MLLLYLLVVGISLLRVESTVSTTTVPNIKGNLRIGGVFPILTENDEVDVVGIMRMVRLYQL
jgi:hypothetical protein